MDSIQYLYYFSSDELYLLETKRLGLPTQASMSDIYKWLIFFKKDDKFVTLNFINMIKEESCEYRSFAEAELKFDLRTAQLSYQGNVYTLSRNDPNLISPDIKAVTQNFLLRLV